MDIGPHARSPSSVNFVDRDDAATLTEEREERDMERHRLRKARASGKFFSWCTVDGISPIIVERDDTPMSSPASPTSSRRVSRHIEDLAREREEEKRREREREKTLEKLRKEEKKRRRGKHGDG